jgi:hypothetical protein
MCAHGWFLVAGTSPPLPPKPDYGFSGRKVAVAPASPGLPNSAANPASKVSSLFNPHRARSGSVQRILSAVLLMISSSLEGLSGRSTTDRIFSINALRPGSPVRLTDVNE